MSHEKQADITGVVVRRVSLSDFAIDRVLDRHGIGAKFEDRGGIGLKSPFTGSCFAEGRRDSQPIVVCGNSFLRERQFDHLPARQFSLDHLLRIFRQRQFGLA